MDDANHFSEIDFGSFKKGDQVDVQLSDGRNVNLFEAARDIFWLPIEPKFQRNRDDNGKIVYRSPPECATEFLVQFKAAVARMPKLHTFASEQMDPRRIVSLVDGFPFEVGLLMRCEGRDQTETWSDFLHIFLATITEEKGRINKLHCGNELSGSLARIDPRYHAAMPYLISLDLSIASVFTTLGRGKFLGSRMRNKIRFRQNLAILRDVMCQAMELRELNISLDCNSEYVRWGFPFLCLYNLISQPPDKINVWKHLRYLKLGNINGRSRVLLPLIKAHVTTLRHLHLDQCRPTEFFAAELSQLEGLHLESIIISDSDILESDLVSEEELLRFIHREDVQDEELAKMIGQGKFVTHNRHHDILDHNTLRNSEASLDDIVGQSSVRRSDTDSDSEVGTDLDYETRYFTSAAGHALAELSF